MSQPAISFKSYIFLANRLHAGFTLLVLLMEFMLFKSLYLFADFNDDSYMYIFAAFAHLDISIWPIGYSKFLALFHYISHSDNALVFFQYMFLQLATLYFYYTITYLLSITKSTRTILWLFLFINPLALYLSNTINSDAIFAALTLLWLAQLLWIIHKPNLLEVFAHALLLATCFTIRNTAYYYPLISLTAFVLSKQNWQIKITGILFPFLLIIPFIIYTKKASEKMIGYPVYSFFTGWQLANNALYIYDQISVNPDDLPTPEAKELHREAVRFLQKVDPNLYRGYLNSYEGNFFIKQADAPLKQYYAKHFNYDNKLALINSWGKASVIFEPFGIYVLTHYPVQYLLYFVMPNAKHYFVPPLSHLEIYNYGENKVDETTKNWFNYRSINIRCFSNTFQGIILFPYIGMFLLINIFFIWQCILVFKRTNKDAHFRAIFGLTIVFFLSNFFFSIVSTQNILRYQVVPMIFLACFGLVFMDYIAVTKKDQHTAADNTATPAASYHI